MFDKSITKIENKFFTSYMFIKSTFTDDLLSLIKYNIYNNLSLKIKENRKNTLKTSLSILQESLSIL